MHKRTRRLQVGRLSGRARCFGSFGEGWKGGFIHPSAVFCNGVRRKLGSPCGFEVFSFSCQMSIQVYEWRETGIRLAVETTYRGYSGLRETFRIRSYFHKGLRMNEKTQRKFGEGRANRVNFQSISITVSDSISEQVKFTHRFEIYPEYLCLSPFISCYLKINTVAWKKPDQREPDVHCFQGLAVK